MTLLADKIDQAEGYPTAESREREFSQRVRELLPAVQLAHLDAQTSVETAIETLKGVEPEALNVPPITAFCMALEATVPDNWEQSDKDLAYDLRIVETKLREALNEFYGETREADESTVQMLSRIRRMCVLVASCAFMIHDNDQKRKNSYRQGSRKGKDTEPE